MTLPPNNACHNGSFVRGSANRYSGAKAFLHQPVNEGSLAADPSKKIVPTTIL
jgi:hypothetical protein